MNDESARVFSFTVPGKAVPWMRTNAVHGRKVTPEEQRRFQQKVRDFAALAGVHLLDGPVVIDVITYLSGRFAPHVRGSGDWDNYGKTVGDALEGLVYTNDCQIVDGRCRKFAPDEGGPRVEVRIEALSKAITPPVRRLGKIRLAPSFIQGRGAGK